MNGKVCVAECSSVNDQSLKKIELKISLKNIRIKNNAQTISVCLFDRQCRMWWKVCLQCEKNVVHQW
jgi:hypothetical protein